MLTRDGHSIEVIGNLTRDPEVREVGENTVCNFSVASNRKRSDGEEVVTYFRCAAWGRTGENVAKYLSKGRAVCVEGTLQSEDGNPRVWVSNDGTPRASFEIYVQGVKCLGGRNGNGNGGGNQDIGNAPPAPSDWDESIPF